MKRKLVRQGQSTMTLALPKEWCDAHSLKPGYDVHISERPPMLCISPGRSRTKTAVSISLKGAAARSALYLLVQTYVHGYDEITVGDVAPELLHVVDEFCTQNTIGLSIVTQHGGSIVIKDLGGQQVEELPALANRVFYMILSMLDEYAEELKKGAFRDKDAIRQQDRSVNRLVYYCLRIANKRWLGTQQELTATFSMLNDVERFADDIAAMWRTSVETPKPTPQQIATLRAMLADVQRAYQKPERPELLATIARLQELRDTLRNAKLRSQPQFHLRSAAERLLDVAQAVVGLKL
ncbi:hypothetical protein HY642_00230 [Candidatus Woesearchaeota archaeon]|nr:hypothetical protein [Candidatus Woesearchaeota archaeon]